MDKLIELLQQIQDLAGVAIDALKGAGGGGEERPEGGAPTGPEGAPEARAGAAPGGAPSGGPGGPPEER